MAESSDELARRAADHVREVVAAAERRAEEIVREAEREAERIRSEYRAQAEELAERAPAPPERPPEPVPAGPAPRGDDAALRLAAMKLAVDGRGREEIAAELETGFGPGDRSELIDDVLARAGRA